MTKLSSIPEHEIAIEFKVCGATAKRMAANRAKRKRKERSVGGAEKRARRVKMMRIRSPIRTALGAYATAVTARGEKRLLNWQYQALLPSSGRPLGECQLKIKSGAPFNVRSIQS